MPTRSSRPRPEDDDALPEDILDLFEVRPAADVAGDDDDELEVLISERGTDWGTTTGDGADDEGDLDLSAPFAPDEPATVRVERFFGALDPRTGRSGRLDDLADLDGDGVAAFASRFAALPGRARGELVSRLVAGAAERYELQFGSLFTLLTRDADATVRQRAVQGVAAEQSAGTLERLVELVEGDPSVDVRAAAARGLEPYTEEAAAGEDVGMDADELRDVLESIAVDQDEPTGLRREALASLAVFGSRGADGYTATVAELITELYDEGDTADQAAALVAMGRTLDRRWLSYIERDLDNDDAELRLAATTAAGQLAETSLVEAVTGRTTDEDDEVREAAVRSLGQIGGPGAIRVLRNLASDPERDDHAAIDEALDEATMGADLA